MIPAFVFPVILSLTARHIFKTGRARRMRWRQPCAHPVNRWSLGFPGGFGVQNEDIVASLRKREFHFEPQQRL